MSRSKKRSFEEEFQSNDDTYEEKLDVVSKERKIDDEERKYSKKAAENENQYNKYIYDSHHKRIFFNKNHSYSDLSDQISSYLPKDFSTFKRYLSMQKASRFNFDQLSKDFNFEIFFVVSQKPVKLENETLMDFKKRVRVVFKLGFLLDNHLDGTDREISLNFMDISDQYTRIFKSVPKPTDETQEGFEQYLEIEARKVEAKLEEYMVIVRTHRTTNWLNSVKTGKEKIVEYYVDRPGFKRTGGEFVNVKTQERYKSLQNSNWLGNFKHGAENRVNYRNEVSQSSNTNQGKNCFDRESSFYTEWHKGQMHGKEIFKYYAYEDGHINILHCSNWHLAKKHGSEFYLHYISDKLFSVKVVEWDNGGKISVMKMAYRNLKDDEEDLVEPKESLYVSFENFNREGYVNGYKTEFRTRNVKNGNHIIIITEYKNGLKNGREKIYTIYNGSKIYMSSTTDYKYGQKWGEEKDFNLVNMEQHSKEAESSQNRLTESEISRDIFSFIPFFQNYINNEGNRTIENILVPGSLLDENVEKIKSLLFNTFDIENKLELVQLSEQKNWQKGFLTMKVEPWKRDLPGGAKRQFFHLPSETQKTYIDPTRTSKTVYTTVNNIKNGMFSIYDLYPDGSEQKTVQGFFKNNLISGPVDLDLDNPEVEHVENYIMGSKTASKWEQVLFDNIKNSEYDKFSNLQDMNFRELKKQNREGLNRVSNRVFFNHVDHEISRNRKQTVVKDLDNGYVQLSSVQLDLHRGPIDDDGQAISDGQDFESVRTFYYNNLFDEIYYDNTSYDYFADNDTEMTSLNSKGKRDGSTYLFSSAENIERGEIDFYYSYYVNDVKIKIVEQDIDNYAFLKSSNIAEKLNLEVNQFWNDFVIPILRENI